MSQKLQGFNLRDIDNGVRPQDDFYHYANGGWLKRNKIPATESRWGSFIIMRYETEHNLKKIVVELLKQKKVTKVSYLTQKIHSKTSYPKQKEVPKIHI